MNHVRTYLIIFFLFNIFMSYGQSRKELEKERKKIQAEIEKVNQLLFSTQKKEKNVLEHLKDINQKISVRKRFIDNINKETQTLTNEINKNKKEISTLESNLAALKKEYVSMIYNSYKSKSKRDKFTYLLSSSDLKQAYKRIKYIKQYSSYRKKQGEEIAAQTSQIEKLNDSLQLKKNEKKQLILIQKEQQLKIESDKKEQENLVSIIKKKEKTYKREIKKKQEEERKLAAKIDAIIKKAIVKSNASKGKKSAKKSTSFALTPKAKELAGKFEKNKGKLPWPVDNGLIVRKYGVQPHPTLKGITIKSTGLHILTKDGTIAKSIFNGKILAVLVSSEGTKSVLVQHGNYITTYKNLEHLYVKMGDTVVTGQNLGTIFTNKVTGKTTLIFVLHKETIRQNPSDWILKK